MPGTPRDRRRPLFLLTVLVIATVGALAGCNSIPPAPLPTVASVELPRYMGTWYEIARLPNRFQAACASDTVARYRLKGDGVEVLNRCRRADGSVDAITGRATPVAGSAGARLRVSFFWPFYGNYWVLDIDRAYETVLVGEPSREYAWILSRSPHIDDAHLQALLARAQSLGFDRSAFVTTRHGAPIADDGT